MNPILIVEDNELNLQLMETILDANGFKFESAKNGVSSVDLATRKDFALVLMDIQLPDIDGYQALALIREVKTQTQLPSVAITGNTTLADQKRVKEAGFDDFVKKPFRIDDLMQVVHQHIRR